MHPKLRKGPLFYKTPPFSTFLTKKHPHFISCLRDWRLLVTMTEPCRLMDDVDFSTSWNIGHSGLDL